MISQVKYSDLPSYALGFQEGFQRGFQIGCQQGLALTLLKQLELKFGTVSDAVRERMQTTDADTLLVYLDRIITAQTLDDVLHQPQ